MKAMIVAGSFDDIRSSDVRFLEEASREGKVFVLIHSDRAAAFEGRAPKFPFTERSFLASAFRWVSGVIPVDVDDMSGFLPFVRILRAEGWISREGRDSDDLRAFCRSAGLQLRIIKDKDLVGFSDPTAAPAETPKGTPRVVVTGCFDWLHSGHVRFFEDVSGIGELHVIVGSDANVRRLKGPKHPMFGEEERRYMVGSMRTVHRAWISSGHGWMDGAPEIATIGPAIYAVNEDGDRPEKREYCLRHGIKYVVLKRIPRDGLPPRESSALRGF